MFPISEADSVDEETGRNAQKEGNDLNSNIFSSDMIILYFGFEMVIDTFEFC